MAPPSLKNSSLLERACHDPKNERQAMKPLGMPSFDDLWDEDEEEEEFGNNEREHTNGELHVSDLIEELDATNGDRSNSKIKKNRALHRGDSDSLGGDSVNLSDMYDAESTKTVNSNINAIDGDDSIFESSAACLHSSMMNGEYTDDYLETTSFLANGDPAHDDLFDPSSSSDEGDEDDDEDDEDGDSDDGDSDASTNGKGHNHVDHNHEVADVQPLTLTPEMERSPSPEEQEDKHQIVAAAVASTSLESPTPQGKEDKPEDEEVSIPVQEHIPEKRMSPEGMKKLGLTESHADMTAAMSLSSWSDLGQGIPRFIYIDWSKTYDARELAEARKHAVSSNKPSQDNETNKKSKKKSRKKYNGLESSPLKEKKRPGLMMSMNSKSNLGKDRKHSKSVLNKLKSKLSFRTSKKKYGDTLSGNLLPDDDMLENDFERDDFERELVDI